jgi:hypothetical protein
VRKIVVGERLQAGRITRVHLGTLEEQPANVHRAVHGAAPRRAAAAARPWKPPRLRASQRLSQCEDCVRHGVGLPELTVKLLPVAHRYVGRKNSAAVWSMPFVQGTVVFSQRIRSVALRLRGGAPF